MTMKKKLAVLVSGGGTNMQAVLDACAGGVINGEVVIVISSSAEAYAIVRAEKAGIPAYICSLKAYGGDKTARDAEVLRLLKSSGSDYVILAGYLGILPEEIINEFPGRIVNIHPALLPKYGGKDYYGLNVHRAVIAAGERESGATAHFVGVEIDGGPIIRQEKLAVLPGDTPESLQQRILTEIEHPLLVGVVRDLCDGKITAGIRR